MSFLKRLVRHKLGFIGGVIIFFIITSTILAPYLTPYSPNRSDFTNIYSPPSLKHLLGCDAMGRDILTRVIYGARVSLMVSLPAVIISALLGTLVGIVSAVGGAFIDTLLQRAVELFLTVPFLVAILVFVSIMQPGISSLIIVLGFIGWARMARLMRGEALSEVEEDYIEAARAYGASTTRLIWRYLFPNISAPLWVASTFNLAAYIITEASVSFLGFGIQPPTPSWGNMLIAAQELNILTSKPWVWLPPGLAISITVISVNFLGDGLRDALDPRYYVKRRR